MNRRKRCVIDASLQTPSSSLPCRDQVLFENLWVPARTPPVFLAHGSDDIVSPPEHSIVMYRELKRANISAELHIYASTTHDFGVRKSKYHYSSWTDSCVQWLTHQKLLDVRKP